MKYEVIINNYQKGGKLFMTPTHKIVEETILEKNRIKIVYEDLTRSEIQLVEKCLAKKLKVL